MKADVGVIVPAAGSGRRFGGKKQFLALAGRPVLYYSLDVFSGIEDVASITVVLPREDMRQGGELVDAWREESHGSLEDRGHPSRLSIHVVEGGARRQDSVLNGILALAKSAEFALVHDAARPLLLAVDARSVIRSMREHGAAVLGAPSHDSVKRVKNGVIVEEIPREEVWTVQTPQGARAAVLREAYERGSGQDFTDESSALRALGASVALVVGSRENMKLTSSDDAKLLERILESRRIGG
jgi:2-C-methyl-D-erythritol 4-phosphate cytidylyltransferase